MTARPDAGADGQDLEAADRRRLEALRAEIEAHTRRYYVEDAPSISDARYDLSGEVPGGDAPKKKGLKAVLQTELDALRKTFLPQPQAQSVHLC